MITNSRKSKKSATSKTAQKPLSALQRQQVRSMLTAIQEVKAFSFDSGALSVGSAGAVYPLTQVAQGVTDIDRVGDQLHGKDIQLSYSITVGATGLIAAADQYNTVRIIVFHWLEDDGIAAPTVATVLNTAISTIPSMSTFNWDTKHLYRIVYDKAHVVFNTPVWNGTAITWSHGVGGTYVTPAPINLPASGKIDFDANTSFGKGHYYLLLITDSAFTPNPSVVFQTRFRFADA